jgi:HAD superfamily hydrolase (TIGR01490 family)
MGTIISKENNSVKSYIVFFDLDQTITKSISGKALTRAAYRKGLMSDPDLLNAIIQSVMFRLKLKDPLKIIDDMVSWVKGIPEKTLIELCSDVTYNDLIPSVYPRAKSEIAIHKAKNAKVVLLSSALTTVCQIIAQHLDLDDILCSDLEVINGYMTGHPVGHLCFGIEKEVRLTEYCKQNNFQPSETWYYGDSISDLPVLSIVGNPVCVNPDKKLKRVATRNNWKIVNWKI